MLGLKLRRRTKRLAGRTRMAGCGDTRRYRRVRCAGVESNLGPVRDLSPLGVCIAGTGSVPAAGTVRALTLRTPAGVLKVRGRVAWVEAKRNRGGGGRRFAVDLSRVDGSVRAALAEVWRRERARAGR